MPVHRIRNVPVIVFFAVLIVYLLLPTKNYLWDGVAFALHIEQPDRFGESMVTPNHPVYVPLGNVVYQSLTKLGARVRAIAVLETINSVFGALSVALLCGILLRISRSVPLSLLLSLAFAFSATWWLFATNADAYIISIYLILQSFACVSWSGRFAPARAGLTHAAAMLFHQLAVFFFPVALLGLWLRHGAESRGRRSLQLMEYALSAIILTLGAYAIGFILKYRSWDSRAFLHWTTYHSPDSSFSFNLLQNTLLSLRGQVRLFLGGRVSLLLEHWNSWLFVLALAAASLLIVLWPVRTGRGVSRPLQAKKMVKLCLMWIGLYVIFLFFWLPQNTFYRLFYLPAIPILIASLARTWQPGRWSIAAVAIGTVCNLLLCIYPYSRTDSNAPLVFALNIQREWPEGSFVYLGSFHSDAWTMCYFNPQITWKTAGLDDLGRLEEELRTVQERKATAWADPSFFNLLSADVEGREWLSAHTREGADLQLTSGKREIRFVELFPTDRGGDSTQAPTSPR